MDIDGDKITDILGGSYMGDVYCYKGSNVGYQSRTIVKQDSIVNTITQETAYLFDRACFTNPSFEDYNNDGLLDMFLCGAHGIRVSINEGTQNEPVYRQRIPLLDVTGLQVSHVLLNEQDVTYYKKEGNGKIVPDLKTFVLFVDWDNDGVKDLITTSSYSYKTFNAVSFHKGIIIKGNHLFEKPVTLFSAGEGVKSLPGEFFVPYVGDYNNDGILDLLIGVTLPINMDNNQIDLELANTFKADLEKRESIAEMEKRRIKNYGYIIIMRGKGHWK